MNASIQGHADSVLLNLRQDFYRRSLCISEFSVRVKKKQAGQKLTGLP
jgi:hypothetical protein